MAVSFYMDVHIPRAVTEQLLRRNINVLTAIEDDASSGADDVLLDRAHGLSRVMMTFDVRFKAMAEHWQRAGREFGGLIYAHPMRVSIGQLVGDLELISKTMQQHEWQNVVEQLPL